MKSHKINRSIFAIPHPIAPLLKKKGSAMPIPIIDPSQATTNERLTRLEAIAEQHTLALAEIKAHIARVEDRMDKSFRWLVGILFTILLAILGATVTILLNLPK